MNRRIPLIIAAVLMATAMLFASGCDVISGLVGQPKPVTAADNEEAGPHAGHNRNDSFEVTVEIDDEKKTFTAKHIELCDGRVLMDYFSDYFIDGDDSLYFDKADEDGYLHNDMRFEFRSGKTAADYENEETFLLMEFRVVDRKEMTIGGIDCFGYSCSAPIPGASTRALGSGSIYYYVELPDGVLEIELRYDREDYHEAVPMMRAMLQTVEFNV